MSGRRDPVRDRPRALPRPRPHGRRRPSVIDGRPLSGTVGRGARPDLQPATAGRARPPGATVARDRSRPPWPRRATRCSTSPTSTASRAIVRARLRAGLDPGQVQLHHLGIDVRRGAPLPAPGRPDPLLRPGAAAAAEVLIAQPAAQPGLWPLRHLRRPADRAGAHRRARRPRHRPPAAARPRVLAAEGARRRPGHPQRAGPAYREELHDVARTARAREPVDARPDDRPAGRRLRPSRRPDCPTTDRTLLQAAARRRAAEPSSGTLADQVDPRSSGRAIARAAPPAPRRRRAEARTVAAEPRPRARVLQRPRRLHRRTAASTSRSSAPAQSHAGAVDQRHRQPRRSASQVSESGRATPGRATAARTSSPRGRNDPVSDPPGEAIYLRDEETGEVWWRRPRCRSAASSAVRRPPRPGLQPLRARGTHGIAARPAAVRRRPTTRSRSRCLHRREPVGPRRAGSRSPPTPSGCSARRASDARRTSSPRWTPRPARCCAQPLERRFGGRVAFVDLGAAARPRGPATAPSSSAATARRRPGGLDRRAALSGARRRRRSTPARRLQTQLRPCRRRADRGRLPARRGATMRGRRGRPTSSDARRAPIARRRCDDVDAHWDDVARHRPGAHARPGAGPAAQPLAALPDAGLPAVGAVGASTSPAARTASATSCRT